LEKKKPEKGEESDVLGGSPVLRPCGEAVRGKVTVIGLRGRGANGEAILRRVEYGQK